MKSSFSIHGADRQDGASHVPKMVTVIFHSRFLPRLDTRWHTHLAHTILFSLLALILLSL
jgi:hypothetical protein